VEGDGVIRDMTGRELMQFSFSEGENRIPVSALSQGMYLVCLKTKQGSEVVRLVIDE
jgi:hypothetical protein